ncbi:MAG: hypothetical protein CMF50_08470 [Legionellales bacterium]|nr:hypothetical protein [Legionellales bacterium]|tara:strand:- start:2479 stop:3003 length:525 start_codon:yes stop_codon:yes gene_type:complete
MSNLSLLEKLDDINHAKLKHIQAMQTARRELLLIASLLAAVPGLLVMFFSHQTGSILGTPLILGILTTMVVQIGIFQLLYKSMISRDPNRVYSNYVSAQQYIAKIERSGGFIWHYESFFKKSTEINRRKAYQVMRESKYRKPIKNSFCYYDMVQYLMILRQRHAKQQASQFQPG